MPRDHRDYLVALVQAHQEWATGIELGLGSGLLFGRLIDAGMDMRGVDLGRRPERRAAVESIRQGQPVYWMSTTEALEHFADGWADFIFIDAAHSYEAVRADIINWRPKLASGGWFGGHDYHPNHPGVMRAVDELVPGRVLHPHAIWSAHA